MYLYMHMYTCTCLSIAKRCIITTYQHKMCDKHCQYCRILILTLLSGAAQVISDKAGRQPAHLAAMRDHRNILEYLYDKGIDLACRDAQGKLSVHYAAQYGGACVTSSYQIIW